MPLFAAGVSHHEVGAEAVASLARYTDEITERLLAAGTGVRGVVPLATCNRFELYLDVDGFHSAVDHTMAAVIEAVDDPGVRDAFVVYAGQGVVEHLFEVASGLDSMVVGEVEIVGQVRTALAEAESSVTPPLRRLFQHALTTSKAVVTGTGLGAAGRSLASVGLDLAGVEDWAAARVVLVGTGNYARVVVADLSRRGCSRIGVFSRSGQAEQFATSHPVGAVAAGHLADALHAADLVVCCSGTGEAILTPELFAEASRDPGRTLPVVDLSGGADVAPGCDDLPGVDLVTLDRIGEVVPLEQSMALIEARETVTRAVAAYLHVEEGRMATPAVTAIRSHVQDIIDREIEQATARYSPETAEAIARSLRRVSNSLLHAPSVRAADLARSGDLDDYRRALKTLFGIVVDAS
ncbi:MAG: glutamyl-tRNA reductase [Propionicimonas sp.]|nr:glutamyl-tRNA reductase [Propionicimonas sp.]